MFSTKRFTPKKYPVSEQIIKERAELEEFLSTKKSLNDYFVEKITPYAHLAAVTDTYSGVQLSYQDVLEQVNLFASGLQGLGVKKGDFVAIFTENNGRFQVVNQAILTCGGISTLRGAAAPVEELDFILSNTECQYLVLQNTAVLKKLQPVLAKHKLKFIVLMFSKDDIPELKIPVYTYDAVITAGENHTFRKPEQSLTDPCTMFYTSGTTGFPKGVLLTHRNLLSQFPSVDYGFLSQPAENTLQILPIWHSYEYTAQIYYFLSGCHLHFTTITGLKNDLIRYKIDTFMSVPRIWEAIRLGIYQQLKKKSKFAYHLFNFAVKTSIKYKLHKMYGERRITNKRGHYKLSSTVYHKIMRSFIKPLHVLFQATLYKKLKNMAGLNFRASISGGGALSAKDELFYDAIGVNLRTGYGLTETSPVLALRGVQDKNFLGAAGKAIKATEIKIVNPETFEELAPFNKGLVLARGPQVMSGYYKNKEATYAVLSEDGWFNTGDLGWLTKDNNLILVGRMKDTIVLSNGENIEPLPIEDACLGSSYIAQIMLVGQDEQNLGALVVPSAEAFEKCGLLADSLVSHDNVTLQNQELKVLIRSEIDIYIQNKAHLKSFEKIHQIEIIKEAFTIDNGMLGQSLKMKRNKISEKYQDLIEKMFDK